LGGLEDDAVTGDEGRRHHARRDGEGEVPGGDDRADAARLIAVDVGLARPLADGSTLAEPQRLPPVVLAVVDRLAHVGIRLGERLPGLEALERRQLGAAATSRARGPGRRSSARGSFVNGAGAAASVGGGSTASGSGSGSACTAGGAISTSSAWPSAKRWRMKDSFEVFSSNRRTR